MRTQLNFFVFHYIYDSEHKHQNTINTKKCMCLSIGIFSAFPSKSYGRNWFLEPWVTHCLGFSRCLSLLRRFSLEKFISLVRLLHAIFQFGLELADAKWYKTNPPLWCSVSSNLLSYVRTHCEKKRFLTLI